MIVDLRVHVWESPDQLGPAAAATLRRRAGQPSALPDATADALTAAMGPVRAVVLHGFVSRALGADIGLDLLRRWATGHEGRVLLSAGIDPLAGGLDERVAAAVAAGCIGMTVNPAACECHPTHSLAMKLYELCERRGLVLFVHQGGHLAPRAPLGFDQSHLFDEVAAGFPSLRIVVSRVGRPWLEPTLSLLAKHANVYADLAELAALPWQLYHTLVLARQQDVIDKLLFASGFPACLPQQAIAALYSINSLTHGTHLPSVPREQIRRIVEVNAIEALGLHQRLGASASAAGDKDANESVGGSAGAGGFAVEAEPGAIVRPADAGAAAAR
jgi:uncharacterized protein